MSQSIIRHPSSYRDPSSVVYIDDEGAIYRNLALDKDVYNQMAVFPKVLCEKENQLFEVEKIPFVSYFYEWSFEQLRDSALFYLDVLDVALEKDLSLSDGTPLNITYKGNGEFIFIDHGSLIKPSDNLWPSYFQFIREFVYPIIYLKYSDIELPSQLLPLLNNNSWQSNYQPDGLSKFSFGFIVIRSNLKLLSKPKSTESLKNGAELVQKKVLQNSISFFRNFLKGLNKKRNNSKWGDYYENSILKDGYIEKKLEVVKSLIEKIQNEITCCVDLGASSGLFPIEITKEFKKLRYLAIESDANAYVSLYQASKSNNFIPVFSNLLQLTIAGGLSGGYSSLLNRLSENGDLIIALGIVHHLIHEGGLSYEYLFEYLTSMSKPKSFLIVEYISEVDEKYRIIRNMNYPYTESIHYFESALNIQYSIISKIQVYETRWVYLAKKK
jgi:hypothetical protein